MLQARDRSHTRDELSRDGPADLAGALALRDGLLQAARSLVDAIGHDPDLADCAAARCALASLLDPPRCALAHRLAALEQGPFPTAPVGMALARFDAAVGDAVDAVRRCRQTEHGTGRCWFSTASGVDGCAEVLWLAHRLC